MNAANSCTDVLADGANDAADKTLSAMGQVRAKLEKRRDRLVVFLRQWNDAPEELSGAERREPAPLVRSKAPVVREVDSSLAQADAVATASTSEAPDSPAPGVEEEPSREPVQAARARYGRPFAHERGSEFRWTSGPTVLNRWLAQRMVIKHADDSR